MLIKYFLDGITVKHAFIPQPISLSLNLFGIEISQDLLQIRYGPFTIAVVEHLKDMQRNYSVKSVIADSKILCTFAARPLAH